MCGALRPPIGAPTAPSVPAPPHRSVGRPQPRTPPHTSMGRSDPQTPPHTFPSCPVETDGAQSPTTAHIPPGRPTSCPTPPHSAPHIYGALRPTIAAPHISIVPHRSGWSSQPHSCPTDRAFLRPTHPWGRPHPSAPHMGVPKPLPSPRAAVSLRCAPRSASSPAPSALSSRPFRFTASPLPPYDTATSALSTPRFPTDFRRTLRCSHAPFSNHQATSAL